MKKHGKIGVNLHGKEIILKMINKNHFLQTIFGLILLFSITKIHALEIPSLTDFISITSLVLFLVFFLIITFLSAKFFKGKLILSGAIAVVVSLISVYQLNKILDLGTLTNILKFEGMSIYIILFIILIPLLVYLEYKFPFFNKILIAGGIGLIVLGWLILLDPNFKTLSLLTGIVSLLIGIINPLHRKHGAVENYKGLKKSVNSPSEPKKLPITKPQQVQKPQPIINTKQKKLNLIKRPIQKQRNIDLIKRQRETKNVAIQQNKIKNEKVSKEKQEESNQIRNSYKAKIDALYKKNSGKKWDNQNKAELKRLQQQMAKDLAKL